MRYVKLGEVISPAKVERCGADNYPVLSITKSDGIVLQSDKFKKRIASSDTEQYKKVKRGQLVQGIHIDEANFGIQSVADVGIVSPAYKIWEVESQKVVPQYLETVLRSPRCIRYYASKFNGSVKRRERITDKDFLAMEIPCPSIEMQQYAVEVLSKSKRILNLYREELQKLDELVKARFVELFGDMANPDCRWSAIKLMDACVTPDDIKCGPFGTQLSKDEYIESGISVWEIPQINSAFKTFPTHFITAFYYKRKSRTAKCIFFDFWRYCHVSQRECGEMCDFSG